MIDQEIINELYKALEMLLKTSKYDLDRLGILSAVGSYGDTLSDREILELLRDWNEIHDNLV